MCIGGEEVGGVMVFGQAGVEQGGQGLGVFGGATVGAEVAAGVIFPELWGVASVLCDVCGDELAVGPVGVCPAKGGDAIWGGIRCAQLDGEVEEGFVGGGGIVAEGAIEVEEEGADVTVEGMRSLREGVHKGTECFVKEVF